MGLSATACWPGICGPVMLVVVWHCMASLDAPVRGFVVSTTGMLPEGRDGCASFVCVLL
jgi:hypothetical protein